MPELFYPHVATLVYGSLWAILPEKLTAILDALAYLRTGGRYSAEELERRVGATVKPTGRVTNAVAVLPLWGVLAPRANMMSETSGGTSVERFTQQFRQAVNDSSVGAIVLDVDSPGGSVHGIQELADAIYGARGVKPIVAVASPLAASAAYWIASAADELVATPSGDVGSIGVLTAHRDESKAEEQAGVKTTLIAAGKYKGEASSIEPLGDEARAHIQERVQAYYDDFVGAVARGRGVTPEAVRNGFGEGRLVRADQARREGMIDRVDTLDNTIERLATGRWRSPRRGPGAEDAGTPVGADLELRRRRLRLAGA